MELAIAGGAVALFLLYEWKKKKDPKNPDKGTDPKDPPKDPPKPLPNIPGTIPCKMPGLFWAPDFFGRGPSRYSNFRVPPYDDNAVPQTLDGVDYWWRQGAADCGPQ